MKMKPVIRRRVAWAIAFGFVLIAMVVGIITFVDLAAIIEGRRCAPSIWKSQWPKYFGCAMAAHEGLAGGLIGAAGALFAAWLAFDAIQEQLAEERERRLRQQAEAKEVAVICVTPAIHAAAMTLRAINDAAGVGGSARIEADKLVALGVTHISNALSSFTVQESIRDLSSDDREIYLQMLGTLNTLVSLNKNPSPILDRPQRLEGQRHALMNMHNYLRELDGDLARVYAMDSETMPPA
jgi:hypothetical protein